MSLDFSGFNQSNANSALAAAEISRQHEEMMRSVAEANQEKIERERRLVAGAEASIAQKELLEQQVEMIQKQNELLSDNYTKLKEMYDAQVDANKEAKEELTRIMERGLNLEVKAHEPFLPDSMKYINGAFTSVNVMREAPVVVLVSNERGKGIDFTDNLSVDERVAEICNVQSVAAAIENMLLAAQELGIGSLWICDVFFAYPEISAWLEKKNPGHGMLVAALAFGYGEEAPRARTRKTLHDVATFIK